MAEDEDLEQDSEAYRKWRSGNDNDKYASSKTPSETGSRSGSYTVPKNDEYALPGEEDNSGGGSWLDGDMNWPVIIAVVLVFALIISSVFAAVMSSTEPEFEKPSEWPAVEGTIIEKDNVNTFITEEYCEDYNEDEYLDDEECWKEFVYQVELTYNYTDKDENTYLLFESLEFWESEWVDVIKREGEDKLFQAFINATDERLTLNSTVKIFYNPETGEAYSEFVELPGDPMGFVGWFLMCCGGFLCVPIILVGIAMSWAQRATGMGGGYGRNRWGPFGGYYGGNNRGGGRARRRSGGISRSGGGGRSGSGSRGGGGRSGGGGRRR